MVKRIPTPQWMREAVFKRDKYTCQYCGSTEGPFHADHVYPYSKGGETTVDNLVTACRRCNGRKQARVGLWPRKVLRVENTETITIVKKPMVGRWVIFLSTQVMFSGLIYGGFTDTNILATSPYATAVFVIGFILILLGV